MDINLFDFYLPEELIAQKPVEIRDHSRLLAINKTNHTYEDKHRYAQPSEMRIFDQTDRKNRQKP